MGRARLCYSSHLAQSDARNQIMSKKYAANALIVLCSFALALILLEALVRLAGETDADGQFTFLGYTLQPYVLPVNQLRLRIDDYVANQEYATIIADEWLGWTYHPNWAWNDGEFTINSAGLRARREYSAQPPPDTLRIAVFGDSFTAGEEVKDKETWSHHLELGLNQAGIRAEVMNFGVGAYGMGQAYLRWQRLGGQFQPDIVIFGLQPENLKRNVNVFRQMLNAAGMPFSKPRFALVDQELTLLNAPALPPEQLIAVFEDFADHPLAAWEFHYGSRQVAAQWWSRSRLAGFLYEALKPEGDAQDVYLPDSEGGMLGKAILTAFGQDVMARDSLFIALHLPLRSHLIRRFEGGDPPYKFLLDYARENYHYIAMEEYLDPRHVENEYWGAQFHYGPQLTALVGRVVADRIATCVRDRSCALPRFEEPSLLFIEVDREP